MNLTLALELPTEADCAWLVARLDTYLKSLYAPDARHLLPVEALAQPGSLFCVARLDGRAVGCGAAVPRSEYVEIKRMYVEPDARGLGIARRILRFLESEVAVQGHRLARLETGVHNTEAMALYASAGYAIIPHFGEYLGSQMSVCYEKRLERVDA